MFRRQTTEVTSTRNVCSYTLQMVRAFIASYDECVGKEEEETARTKKGKNILMARRRENTSRGAFASQIPSKRALGSHDEEVDAWGGTDRKSVQR